eukprot:NODE_135_length_18075_cov_0.518413.p3 type:complete len:635 gc:universal NODE_135_length_18075_cov_0.518413:7419-5515(-)
MKQDPQFSFDFSDDQPIRDILAILKDNRIKIAVEKDNLEKEIQVLDQQSEMAHSKSQFALVSLLQKFQDIESEIKSNTKVIKDITQSCQNIEENLGKLVRQRDKARQAYLLLDAVLDPGFKVDNVKDMTIDEIVKGLEIAKLLNIFPQEDPRIVKIRKTCDTMESKLLDLFQKAYESRDLSVMRRISLMLQPLNESKNCIQAYINQHEFFMQSHNIQINKDELKNAFFDTDIVERISEVQFTAYLRSIRKVFKSLVKSTSEEWHNLNDIFSDYFSVLLSFLDRMFLQVVHSIIDQALRMAENISELHYLRTLMIIHGQLQTLERELLEIEFKFDRSQNRIYQQKVKTLICESIQHELNIDLLCAREVQTCINYYQRILKQLPEHMKVEKSSLMNQLKESGITTAADAVFPFFEKVKVLRFTLEVFERIEFLLSGQELMTKMTCKVYQGLMKALYAQEMNKELSDILTTLKGLGAAKQPDFKCLTNIETLIFFLKTVQHHFEGIVAPLLHYSLIDYKDALAAKNELLGSSENTLQDISLELVGCSERWIDFLLNKQNKLEYRQNEMEIDLSKNSTDTCFEICKFVNSALEWIQKVYKGKNAEQIRLALGNFVLKKLKEHVKTLTVNDMGALLLTK